TNRDLAERIKQGEFREDLYYRLNVLQIAVPPLRQRREDIPAFLNHFISRYCQRHAVPVPEMTPETQAALIGYDWPGNVRELKNVVERLVVRNHSSRIQLADLPPEVVGVERRINATADKTPVTTRADELYDRMTLGGESFWAAVHPLFMARDMTRE